MADPTLELIAQDESGNRNVPNYKYGPGFTAGGYWQITDTNWRHYAPRVGLSLADYPNAMSAPRPEQERVAGLMKQEQGVAPWAPYNPKLRRDLGLRPEGYYGGQQHINIYPLPEHQRYHDPLDWVIAAAGAGAFNQPAPQREERDPDADALDFLKSFIEPPGRGRGEAATASIEEPLTAAFTPSRLGRAESRPLPEPEPMQPMQRLPSAPDTIEPPAQGQVVPPPPIEAMAPIAGSSRPAPPFMPNRPGAENTADPIDQVMRAAGDIGRAGLGLGQMAAQGFNRMVGLGGLNAPGHAAIRPGLGRLADIGTFATGGLTNPLSVEARLAGQAAPAVARDLGEGAPGVRAAAQALPQPGLSTRNVGPPGPPGGVPPIRPPAQPLAPRPPSPEERLILSLAGRGGGAGPPGPPAAGVPGAATPRPGPGIMPREMVRAETAPERYEVKEGAKEGRPMRDLRLQAMRETSDILFRNHQRIEEYKNRSLRVFNSVPRMSPNEKLQIERYLEWQPGMRPVAAPSGEAMDVIEKVIKPAQREAARLWRLLKRDNAVFTDEGLDEFTEGYVHRVRAPNPALLRESPYSPFAGSRTLRQTASGARPRHDWYVLQDAEGNRSTAPLKNGLSREREGYELGQKITVKGKEWEVRAPTTEEIEANTDVRYLHDPVYASLQNMTQLRVAAWNFQTMHEDLLPMLEKNGLVSSAPGQGLRETQVPALRGRYFNETIANAIDDALPSYQDGAEGLAKLWNQINRLSINGMFILPIGHMRNVIADYALARGGLWFEPPAYYRGAQAMRMAWRDLMRTGLFRDSSGTVIGQRQMVPNYSQFYRDATRGGGASMGMTRGNQFGYQAVIRRMTEEMTRIPEADRIAQSTGVWRGMKEMASSFWEASQDTMWSLHDLLWLARTHEIMMERPGVGVGTAAELAERHIANYRVPASVGETAGIPRPIARQLSRWFQHREFVVFNRYKYNKLKAISNTVADANRALTRSGMSGKDRKEALTRLAFLLTASTVLQQGLNFAVQQATGNPEASVHVPGALGIPANVYKIGRDLFLGQYGQAGYDAWMGLASIFTPIPAAGEIIAQSTNRKYGVFGGPPIRGDQLPAGQQLVQSLWHGAQALIPPLSEAARIYQGTGIPMLGLSTPNPQAVARARAGSRRGYRAQERKFRRDLPYSPF